MTVSDLSALRLSNIPPKLLCTAAEGKPNSRTVTDVTHASIRRSHSLALSKSEVALSKREVSGVRMRTMSSTSDLPCLRYVRGQPSFDAGTKVVPTLLGRNPDELENSEDRGSAGGHGNQHVRLRGASIDASKRSARLRQRLVAAGRASCSILQEVLQRSSESRARILPKRTESCRRPPEGDPVLILLPPIHTFPWLADGPGIMLGYVSGRLRRTYPFNPVTR